MKLDDAPEPPPRTPGYECAFADLAPLLDDGLGRVGVEQILQLLLRLG